MHVLEDNGTVTSLASEPLVATILLCAVLRATEASTLRQKVSSLILWLVKDYD